MFLEKTELKLAQLDEILEKNKDKITGLYFGATWCRPCKIYTPILKKHFESVDNIEIIKLDIEENSELIKEYEIKSVPTVIFFNQEIEVARLLGLKTLESVISTVNAIK